MRLQFALSASVVLLAISTAAWVREPQTSAPSPRNLVARAGIGAIGAIVGAGVKSLAVAEFEKKCEQTATAAPKKPKCTKASLDVPIVGCYLRQAASVLVS